MRGDPAEGDVSFRGAHLRSFADQIEIAGAVIRIVGSKRPKSKRLLRNPSENGGAQFCPQVALPRGFEPLFRP